MHGIGIDTSIASFEEVANAITQQEVDKPINSAMEQALRDMIDNLGITNEDVIKALAKINCAKLKDLKTSQVQKFRELLGA